MPSLTAAPASDNTLQLAKLEGLCENRALEGNHRLFDLAFANNVDGLVSSKEVSRRHDVIGISRAHTHVRVP